MWLVNFALRNRYTVYVAMLLTLGDVVAKMFKLFFSN